MTKGRKPKPREVQIAEGRHLKDPQRFKNEVPKTSSEEPTKPEHLTETAAAEWDRVQQLMKAAGLWSATYQTTLELYCETYASYRHAFEKVKQTGAALITKDKNGEPVVRRNPFSVELHKYQDELLKLLTELGLTPSSRSRVSMPDGNGQSDDPFLKLLA